MPDLITSLPQLLLIKPVAARDAKVAYEWFSSESGRDTLLKMGNAPHSIVDTSIERETKTIEEFLRQEEEGSQITWMLCYAGTVIGAAWIDLTENYGVKSPSVHLMIGDPAYRRKGIGKATMNALLSYLEDDGFKIAYSRHLAGNKGVTLLNISTGFKLDGKPYTDSEGLVWQHVKRDLRPHAQQ
jgi:GNAT superfamily N-acetyltransferase